MTTNAENTIATSAETPVSPAMNFPIVPQDSTDVLSKEATEHVKALDTLVKDLARNFVKIGFELNAINSNKYYKELGFKTFDDFVKVQYGFSRSSAYNFINVALKYCVRDDNQNPTKLLKKEYLKFSSSQLVAMLHMNEDEIIKIDPKTSVKEIKKLEKEMNAVKQSTDDEGGGEDEENKIESKKTKPNLRDTIIPVVRINMAKGMTWDEAVTEATKRVCETYLSPERREKDGKNYQIEINIIYPDESAV